MIPSDETVYDEIQSLVGSGDADYVCIGREICPETHLNHFHAHIIFKTARKASWIRTNISDTAHREIVVNEEASIAYCKKDGNIFEAGTVPTREPGKRTDLKKLIENNATLGALMDENPEMYCRFRQGLKDIYDRKRQQQGKIVPTIHWLAGPTGCGKTRLAFGTGEDVWMSSVLPWFDQYNG